MNSVRDDDHSRCFEIVTKKSSVPDPDPPGSEIIWPQGSGSFPFSHQT